MASYKDTFKEYLDKNEIRYEENEEDIIVTYNCDNINLLPLFVSFDPDGDDLVQIFTYDVGGKVPEDKAEKVALTCNELNDKYRWAKFCVEKSRYICMSLDAIVNMETVCDVCMRYIDIMLDIGDEAHPILMKAIWE